MNDSDTLDRAFELGRKCGVAEEKRRIIDGLRNDYDETPSTAAEFADEIESGRL